MLRLRSAGQVCVYDYQLRVSLSEVEGRSSTIPLISVRINVFFIIIAK